jgi:DNA-binding Lrp family transcriptional regulator
MQNADLLNALIEVKITPQRDMGFDRIAERIYQFDEVSSLFLMSGDYDLCVLIEGSTMSEVSTFVFKYLSTIEGVSGTATHFILKKYKENGKILNPAPEQEKSGIFV